MTDFFRGSVVVVYGGSQLVDVNVKSVTSNPKIGFVLTGTKYSGVGYVVSMTGDLLILKVYLQLILFNDLSQGT